MAIFWGVSLQNVLRNWGTNAGSTSGENPISPSFTIALIGTLFLFAESLVFAYLGITRCNSSAIGILFTPPLAVQIFGTIFYALGALLHAWSVRVRGRYAVSWAMSEDHRIITDAPYSVVRHPSYLGYLLMIVGMTLIWGNTVTLGPWIAIPGYYFVSIYEEAMLIEQFGEEYRRYMNDVGAFIPRLAWPREVQGEK
ncbi:isoprenylcysteine carboxylmethyltransferase family protein [Candidatus Bathyarchaeota archaeon]|nr:isoprenylcysteine carboxylmethyltransferase family protein [Candidatus Bathyarchaeota archaeon]MBT4320731.1 isoprenylcysteine carboxylmethyltransferase family protein [Candidatus Bathyarchaeota archaeon]MBT4424292.1 isoprenylcysteine carboxylmethyltransferase family protein [Candidatus Bathyarchaeota archaeon]MBT5642561.1 isoprenylcysteine carboxylmethyltransferase family protein [Candidatus Bathyarchaeota archaeon]MBT6604237.1 isoprenylcysteine carboxylmethyltransferase family protein [Cand